MPATLSGVWDWLQALLKLKPESIHAAVEQQSPRPTNIFDRSAGRWRATILKSTCLLWGNYQAVCALLAAAGIDCDDCPPKRWQSEVGVRAKEKAEKDNHWKNALKSHALTLFPPEKFPDLRVTLATSDALLLAWYCRQQRSPQVAVPRKARRV